MTCGWLKKLQAMRGFNFAASLPAPPDDFFTASQGRLNGCHYVYIRRLPESLFNIFASTGLEFRLTLMV
jgi:hypothetical protein